MTPVLIGLGSNLGDSIALLQQAVDILGRDANLEAVSCLVRTEPMYFTDQPQFVNGALKAWTSEGPLSFLKRLKAVEHLLGRQERTRNGPREIDLDLLTYGSAIYHHPLLTLPHPRIGERRFVLQPLNDIDPDAVIPGIGKVSDLLMQTQDQAGSVQTINDAALSISSSR